MIVLKRNSNGSLIRSATGSLCTTCCGSGDPNTFTGGTIIADNPSMNRRVFLVQVYINEYGWDWTVLNTMAWSGGFTNVLRSTPEEKAFSTSLQIGEYLTGTITCYWNGRVTLTPQTWTTDWGDGMIINYDVEAITSQLVGEYTS